MKTIQILRFSIIVIGLLFVSEASAQYSKEARKAAKEKADKDARKEAKRMKKEGYINLPGDLPLEKQLQRSFEMQYEFDDSGMNKFLVATGTATSGSGAVAASNAMDNARVELAGLISSQVANLIKTNKASTQLSPEDVETIDKFLSSSQTFVNAELGMINPVVKAERKVNNKVIERRVVVGYSFENAKKVAQNLVKKELQEELDANDAELQKLLGL